MRDRLIDYLLGALDPAEQQQVERELATNPVLRHELELLEARISTLRGQVERYEPPQDLISQTCSAVEAYENERKVARKDRSLFDASTEKSSNVGRWRFVDVLIATGICIAASLLFFPAIVNSRVHSQIVACQNNLREIGLALQLYNEQNDNFFPVVPSHGKLANAGCYTMALCDQDLVSNTGVFICPSSPLAQRRQIWFVPTREQVENAHGQELLVLRQTMGGSYAYTLGYVAGGKHHATRNLRRPYFVIMADSPNPFSAGMSSANHGGNGQNVLFEDFHVSYVVQNSAVSGDDGFFVNRYGLTAAGVDFEDAVVGSSESSPRVLVGP